MPTTPRNKAQEGVRTAKNRESRARELLMRPTLLKEVVADIQTAFSIHGEDLLIEMLYLAMSSRGLSDPISIIVQGPSGSGKTYLIDSVCRFLPPKDLWTATHMRAKALYYDPTGVKHKVINGKERTRLTGAEVQESTSAIRQLISDKEIVNRSVSSDREGVAQRVEGPVCYLESTTLDDDDIFDEDLSRCLLMRTTSDPEHRRGVIQTIGSRFDPKRPAAADQKEIISMHQLIQRKLLKPRKVVIPFHVELAESFPVSGDNMTRLFERLLFTVAAITHLHQHQRKNDNGAVVSTLDDYRKAKPIIDRCMSDATSRSLKGAQRSVYNAVREAGEVKRSDVVKAVAPPGKFRKGHQATAAKQAINALIEQCALVEISKGRGSRSGILRCYELPNL